MKSEILQIENSNRFLSYIKYMPFSYIPRQTDEQTNCLLNVYEYMNIVEEE